MRTTSLLLLIFVPCLFAQGGANCKQVGGSVSTNFIDQTTTLGTATGDLRGGLGVEVVSISSGANGSTVFHNRHRWVTESGDTIFTKEAAATAYPAMGLPGLLRRQLQRRGEDHRRHRQIRGRVRNAGCLRLREPEPWAGSPALRGASLLPAGARAMICCIEDWSKFGREKTAMIDVLAGDRVVRRAADAGCSLINIRDIQNSVQGG